QYVLLFFFQAEDGIRDLIVTGVQTCALPIYIRPSPRKQSYALRWAAPLRSFARVSLVQAMREEAHAVDLSCGARARLKHLGETRSEERRVGKECRSGRWPCH